METGRGREGTMDERTLGPTGAWAQVEEGKARQKYWLNQARIAQGTSLGAWEGSVDERWRPEGEVAIQVDGRSVTR